jgi:hypothetical protein
MNPDQPIKVIELRNYLIKPNLRDRFISYFERNFVESQNILGGFVLGAFSIKTEAERFFWIRGFSDMNSRSCFLPEFYGGEVWKEFGAGANEMMLEWHHVHLLKPLANSKTEDFSTEKRFSVINFYFTEDGKIGELTDLLQTAKEFSGASVWVSEMTENDFPQLPVIQDGNLLAVITNYKNEEEYAAQEELENDIKKLIKKHERLVLSKAF